MLKYGTKKMLPHHINSILFEAWDAFNMSADNIARVRFLKKNLPPLIPPELTMDIQAFSASIQISSGSKSEEINKISRSTVAPIESIETSTDDPMVVLRSKGSQKSSSNISSDLQHMTMWGN